MYSFSAGLALRNVALPNRVPYLIPCPFVCSLGITGMREIRTSKVPRYVALSNSLERSEDLGIFAVLISLMPEIPIGFLTRPYPQVLAIVLRVYTTMLIKRDICTRHTAKTLR